MEPQKSVPEIFLKPYNPAEQEPAMIDLWEKSGFANPDICVKKGVTNADAEPFSIVLPPPNVTGTLHMGHAAMLAIEDILIRYNRMRGKKTLWLPGTDSAAIATQAKVEDTLYKEEKKTRHDIGREALLAKIDIFTEASKEIIIDQIKKMGSSLDWSRYAYTMDDKRYKAVMTAFIRMYEAGLIYRGDRIVNWDPKLQTTVSDEEIEYKEQKDPFYYFQYGPFVIGTVRPETKFGDKYVVMHPDDERYKEYKEGQKLEVKWITGPIQATVIKDSSIDMSLGSGVMTLTPSHSVVDFEILQNFGKRNPGTIIAMEQVIDERGILNAPIAGNFAGQHIKKARAAIVEKMKEEGLVVKIDENYVHNIATNSRGGGIIEPQIKRQWFIGVNKPVQFPDGSTATLKEKMREVVENKVVQIMPEHFDKTYYHWIDNLRDWNISRQIWFGHRIPAWFKDNEVKVQIESPGADWEQDPDVLDTWFSSGLWTFSTLGWPEETPDLKTYHPTAVLETGYDILFFWVARMILMSTFLVGEVPFRHVYLHGLVRDGQGRKMSKSLGNIIDPLTMIEKYGADATRLSLIIGAAPGNDLKLSEDRVRGYKHFSNKLWNVARFVLENGDALDAALNEADDLKLKQFRSIIRSVSGHINDFYLSHAADLIYHYIWDVFAADIIEDSKVIFRGEDDTAKESRKRLLNHILKESLKLLHPFMPFVTEAIWQQLPQKDSDVLMVAKWPLQDPV